MLLTDALVRRICHDLANPLAALRMELELAGSVHDGLHGDLQPAVDALGARLELVRHVFGGKEVAPDAFARMVGDALHHRHAEIEFAPDAAPEAMRAVAMLLPALCEQLGGRGRVAATVGADALLVQIEAPRNLPDSALQAALRGEVGAQSVLAPLAAAARLVGPMEIREEQGAAGPVFAIRQLLTLQPGQQPGQQPGKG